MALFSAWKTMSGVPGSWSTCVSKSYPSDDKQLCTDRSGAVFRRLTAAILRLVSGAASMSYSHRLYDGKTILPLLCRPTTWLPGAASRDLHRRGTHALQTPFSIRWQTRQQVPSRIPIVAVLHLQSSAPASDGAQHLLCARRIENHPGTPEDEPPREASTPSRELDA